MPRSKIVMFATFREVRQTENERRAAWERFGKNKNACHAAWERLSPRLFPQKVSSEMPRTSYFKLFSRLFRAPPEHPSCAHQKIDQLKWTPKSAPGDRTKHLFSNSFEHFWSSTRTPTFRTSKNRSAQVDAKERPRRLHETVIFKRFFAHFGFRAPLGDRPRRALHFQNMQYRIGF